MTSQILRATNVTTTDQMTNEENMKVVLSESEGNS